MEFTKTELLDIYTGLEMLWKSRLRQAHRHSQNPDKYDHFTEKAKEVDTLRSRISAKLK